MKFPEPEAAGEHSAVRVVSVDMDVTVPVNSSQNMSHEFLGGAAVGGHCVGETEIVAEGVADRDNDGDMEGVTDGVAETDMDGVTDGVAGRIWTASQTASQMIWLRRIRTGSV